ncbi:YbjQ family protein [Desulfobacter curvatus]|uniref:YbjQ family protein n=1 Tax=Desulfobacter curvatus TaxID=2290 RepID=UPI001B7F7EA7|nr:heavy metal-binding domain-containing protein [Desulfobacter curvatus]
MTNTEEIPGKRTTAFHGVVSGSTVRAKHVRRDLMASFKNIFGGELKVFCDNYLVRLTTITLTGLS